MRLKLIIALALVGISLAATASPTWAPSPLFQSGLNKIVSGQASVTISTTFVTTFSTAPKVAMGMYNLSSGVASSSLNFACTTGTITATSFTITCKSIAPTLFSYMSISYLAVSTSVTYVGVANNIHQLEQLGNIAPVATGTGLRSTIMTAPLGMSFVLTNNPKAFVFLMGFTISTSTGLFEWDTQAWLNTSSSYQLKLTVYGGTKITSFSYSRFVFDQVAAESTYTTFGTWGIAIASDSSWAPLTLTLPILFPTNLIVGLVQVNFSSTQSINFAYSISTSVSCAGSMSFNNISMGYWSLRVRTCPGSFPYYDNSTQLCYSACSSYTFLSSANTACVPCYYACLSCSTTTPTVCLSCSSSDFRTLIAGSCSCNPGYYDAGAAVCALCNYTCTTCSSPTTCVSCSAANFRTLASPACPCNIGYVDVGTAMCAVCSATLVGCTSCSSTSVCTTCNTAGKFVISGTACVCSAGYYLSGTSCIACSASIPGCLTCSSSSVCTSCNVAGNFLASGTTCVCASGFALSGSACVSCATLMSGCVDCSSVSICSTCAPTFIMNIGTGLCQCDVGFLLSGGACVGCNVLPGCLACSASGCTNCDSTTFFSLSSNTCVCNPGLFLDGSTCTSCSSAMPGCTSCTSVTNCLTCNAALHFVLSGASCVCQSSYALSGSTCTLCTSNLTGCTSCSSLSVCTGCTGSLVLSGGVCTCSAGLCLNGVTTSCDACTLTLPGCLFCTSCGTCTACDMSLGMVLSAGACVCTSGQVLNNGVCQLCGVTMPGCTSCSSINTCTACNTTGNFGLSGSSCNCTSGYFLDVSACTVCSSVIAGCLQCSNSTNCTSCDTMNYFQQSGPTCACMPTFTLASGACTCQPSIEVLSGSTCVACSLNCAACTVTTTNCTSCNAPLQLSGTTCLCPTTTYFQISTCVNCDPICQNCSGPGATSCTSCPPTYSLSLGSCVCASNTFLNATSSLCVACNYACLTCNGPTGVDCATCSPDRTFTSGSCICNAPLLDIGVAACQTTIGNCLIGYAPAANGACEEICGDGRMFVLPCDDGNTISGDGCSSSCAIEKDYTCINGSTSSASVCSYTKPITFTLVQTIKNLTGNSVNFYITVSPAILSLNSLDFSQAFSCDLNNSAQLSFTYDGAGNLVVTAQYSASIQGRNVSVQFNPQASSRFFFATPNSNMNFSVDPTNNVAADYYEDSVYSGVALSNTLCTVLLGVTLTGLILSFITTKFIGIEMVGVVQAAFIGLAMIKYIPPTLAPLSKISLINGLNTAFNSNSTSKFESQTTLPNRFAALNYGIPMAFSLNYTLILLLLPMVVSLVLWVVSKTCYKEGPKHENCSKWSISALKPWGLTAVMFLLYHTIVSVLLFALNSSAASTEMIVASAVDAIVALGASAAVLALFWYRPDNFGSYKSAFKPDKISQMHYWVIALNRVCLAYLLVGADGTDYTGYIVLVIPLLMTGYLLVRRPYLQLYNNVRATLNELVILFCVCCYGYYRAFLTHTMHLSPVAQVLPWVEIGVLFVCVFTNIVIMVKYSCDRKKDKKAEKAEEEAAKVDQMQEAGKAQLVEETKLRLQGVTDTSRTNNPFNIRTALQGRKVFKPESIQMEGENPLSGTAETPKEAVPPGTINIDTKAICTEKLTPKVVRMTPKPSPKPVLHTPRARLQEGLLEKQAVKAWTEHGGIPPEEAEAVNVEFDAI